MPDPHPSVGLKGQNIHCLALKRRKTNNNESTVKICQKLTRDVSCQTLPTHTKSSNSYKDQTTQTPLSPKVKLESEDLSLATIRSIARPPTSRQTVTDYSGLKSASKRKDTADEHRSLFLPSPSFEKPKKQNHLIMAHNNFAGSSSNSQTIQTRAEEYPAEWYKAKHANEPHTRSELHAFQYIKTLIQSRGNARNAEQLETLFSELRVWLHRAECHEFISKTIIQKSKLLEDEGLPAVIHSAPNFYPFDIQADCELLYSKWVIGNLDPHLLRGLEVTRKKMKDGKSGVTQGFDKAYPWRVSCDYIGQGNLINGQWWPLQICAMRDGAHGEIQGGIHGQAGKGAYSVVISGGAYKDIDKGDEVEYCGTAGANGVLSPATKLMMEAFNFQNPLRLLRSSKSVKSGVYRPSEGIRYDGLYLVVETHLLDPEKAMYRFSLRRSGNQPPIRYQGVEVRPTFEQLRELEKIHDIRASEAKAQKLALREA